MLGVLTSARVYSKVDYVFGSILLTVTKSFCFGENSTRKPVCLLSLLTICQVSSNSQTEEMLPFFCGTGGITNAEDT